MHTYIYVEGRGGTIQGVRHLLGSLNVSPTGKGESTILSNDGGHCDFSYFVDFVDMGTEAQSVDISFPSPHI